MAATSDMWNSLMRESNTRPKVMPGWASFSPVGGERTSGVGSLVIVAGDTPMSNCDNSATYCVGEHEGSNYVVFESVITVGVGDRVVLGGTCGRSSCVAPSTTGCTVEPGLCLPEPSWLCLVLCRICPPEPSWLYLVLCRSSYVAPSTTGRTAEPGFSPPVPSCMCLVLCRI